MSPRSVSRLTGSAAGAVVAATAAAAAAADNQAGWFLLVAWLAALVLAGGAARIALRGGGPAGEGGAPRLEAALVDRGDSPSSHVNRREYAVLLADRLAELPPDYREVLVLRHFDDLPFDEVARRMGRSAP